MKSSANRSIAPRYVAVLGDVVDSRRIRGRQRAHIQERLLELLAQLNRRFDRSLVAPFAITLGDEFEGVLRTGDEETAIPDIVWEIEQSLPDVHVRLGFGRGEIDTAIGPDPRMMDGPVFHKTREAIEYAAQHQLLGGVFRGFGADWDLILSGMARVLHRQRSQWSNQQRRTARLLREGARQVDAATALKVTKQAVSSSARAAGWEAYAEGEIAWRKALALSCADGSRGLTEAAGAI